MKPSPCILLAGILTFAAGVPAQLAPPPPTNVNGAPVLSAAGVRLEYTQAQLDAQARAARSAGTAALPLPGDPQGALADLSGEIAPVWQYFAFGSGIGASRFVVSEVDGVTELITGGGGGGFGADTYWFILRHNPVTKGYDQVFVSPVVPGETIRRLALAQTVAGPKLVVGTVQGKVQVWDQASRSLELQFQVPGGSLEALCVADVVPGGRPEIVVTRSTHLYVYGLAGGLFWDLGGAGGTDVVVDQMDSDPALEIATTDGRVVDADSKLVQWTWPGGFGIALRAGDIDADGKAELIGAPAWNFVYAYDVDTQLPKWSIPIFNTGAINLADVDADGVLELLIGEAQWGGELAYSTVTQQLEWEIPNPEHGTTDVACGDIDGDGKTEIIWGAGHTSTGEDRLFVGDWVTKQQEWSSVDLVGPFRGPARGDVDGDGTPELVSVTNESESGYSAGRILVFDGADLHLRALSASVAGGLGWSGTHDVKLRNIDADPALEIVVGTSTTYSGTIEIYDYNGTTTFTKQWQVPTPLPSGAFRSVEVADVDADGQLEVVGGADNYVYVYSLSPAKEEWHSLSVGAWVSALSVGQTDADAALEIVALGSAGGAYIFDGASKALESLLPGNWRCVRTVAGRPGKPDIVILGDALGTVTAYQHDGALYAVKTSGSFGSKPIDGITPGALEHLWVGSNGTLSLFSTWGGTAAWSSGPFGTVFGANAAFLFPEARTVVTAGTYGLVGFGPP